ncbi:MAG TPA: DnaD domain protein [Thermomicrobiales bacterium]|nr:DnaD domain protein [Thermomicrobiales bacterium]
MLSRLIRDVWSPLEVKLVLAVAALGGLREPVQEEAVLLDEGLAAGVRADGSSRSVIERLLESIELATARGVLLRLVDDTDAYWLILGVEANRRRIRSGLTVAGDTTARWRGTLRVERPSIFTLYEQNVGLVTPIIADRLVEAIERYPEAWVEDAIEEAVAYNRRNWRYIQRILENWASEGRTDEANRRGPTRDLNREKHLRGKYAHLFRRDDLPDL